jgi:hypothetical protein
VEYNLEESEQAGILSWLDADGNRDAPAEITASARTPAVPSPASFEYFLWASDSNGLHRIGVGRELPFHWEPWLLDALALDDSNECDAQPTEEEQLEMEDNVWETRTDLPEDGRDDYLLSLWEQEHSTEEAADIIFHTSSMDKQELEELEAAAQLDGRDEMDDYEYFLSVWEHSTAAVLAAIDGDSFSLTNVPVALWANRSVVLAAVRRFGAVDSLDFAAPRLLASGEFMLAAARLDEEAIYCAAPQLQRDKAFVRAALHQAVRDGKPQPSVVHEMVRALPMNSSLRVARSTVRPHSYCNGLCVRAACEDRPASVARSRIRV